AEHVSILVIWWQLSVPRGVTWLSSDQVWMKIRGVALRFCASFAFLIRRFAPLCSWTHRSANPFFRLSALAREEFSAVTNLSRIFRNVFAVFMMARSGPTASRCHLRWKHWLLHP